MSNCSPIQAGGSHIPSGRHRFFDSGSSCKSNLCRLNGNAPKYFCRATLGSSAYSEAGNASTVTAFGRSL